MNTRLVSWSRYALLAGIVLALVLVIPTPWFPFQLTKVAALAACLAISAVLFVVGGGMRELTRAHGIIAALTVGVLPLVYALSALRSPDQSLSLTGYSIETDTMLFVLIAATLYVLSFALFRTLRTVRMLSSVVFSSLVAAMLFQLLSIFSGTPAIPFETFADRSVNLVGKWNDLGLLAALLALLLMSRVELRESTTLWRTLSALGVVLCVGLLAFVNFPLAWALLLAGSVMIGFLAIMRQRAEAGAPGAPMLPWYAAAGAILSVLFLLYGSAINTSVTSLFPVSSLEVRPGIQSTLDIINKSREGTGDLLLGTGPNTFSAGWLQHKPAEVNRTPFWNLDFSVGYSTFATAFGSVGLLGALAWLLPLGLLGAGVVRAARINALSREERYSATILSVGTLFLFAAIVLYVPSQNIVLLAFALAGAAFGFLWRQGRSAPEDAPIASIRQGLFTLTLGGVLLLCVVASGFVSARRLVAQTHTGAGLYALAQGNVDEAKKRAESALSIERTGDALRLASDAGVQTLARIASDRNLKPEDARAQFTSEVQRVVPLGQEAAARSPHDYRAHLSLARVYDLLASLKVENAYQSAVEAYTTAVRYNPTSPMIPLALARLEAGAGNAQKTEEAVTKALQLKPDYTDAILFVVQINVANNDLQSAIRNTQIAVQTAPGVASIWFQLGLLYYAGGDAKSAVPPLEQALTLVPEYANAKYFLGLAYYKDGRQNDALRMFEELNKTNPDNPEVTTIVSNLRAGKDPLEGIEGATPEDRTTAPVAQ